MSLQPLTHCGHALPRKGRAMFQLRGCWGKYAVWHVYERVCCNSTSQPRTFLQPGSIGAMNVGGDRVPMANLMSAPSLHFLQTKSSFSLRVPQAKRLNQPMPAVYNWANKTADHANRVHYGGFILRYQKSVALGISLPYRLHSFVLILKPAFFDPYYTNDHDRAHTRCGSLAE